MPLQPPQRYAPEIGMFSSASFTNTGANDETTDILGKATLCTQPALEYKLRSPEALPMDYPSAFMPTPWSPLQKYTQIFIWCLSERIEMICQRMHKENIYGLKLIVLCVLQSYREALVTKSTGLSCTQFVVPVLKPIIKNPVNTKYEKMLRDCVGVRTRLRSRLTDGMKALRVWEQRVGRRSTVFGADPITGKDSVMLLTQMTLHESLAEMVHCMIAAVSRLDSINAECRFLSMKYLDRHSSNAITVTQLKIPN